MRLAGGWSGQTFPRVHLHSCEPRQTAAKGSDGGQGQLLSGAVGGAHVPESRVSHARGAGGDLERASPRALGGRGERAEEVRA